MSIEERRKYLTKMEPMYRKGGKGERGRLLDEMEAVTGMHRKSLTRLLQPGISLERRAWRGRRKRTYGPEVQDVIGVVWESLDYICAERITPVLLTTAQHLAGFGEVRLTPELEAQLGSVSRATVARVLGRLRQYKRRLPQKGPGKAGKIRAGIPMGRIPWDTADPGHFETDLVHHCGPAPVGTYVHTLQLVDIATSWSERAAIYGRSEEQMVKGFERIESRLPFPIKEIHPDNGSEFFNGHVMRYFGRDIMPVHVSRSRPYQKNDNRLVERKNSTLVRAFFGPWRMDTRAQCDRVNALYDEMWRYYNLFQPVQHLVEKRMEDGRLRRKWDEPKTPFERLLETRVLAPDVAERLRKLRTATNPLALRRWIRDESAAIFDEIGDASEASQIA
ncbi:MAG: hypothetical protein ACRDRT_04130 [Pseudonocardiaceae bacterium]